MKMPLKINKHVKITFLNDIPDYVADVDSIGGWDSKSDWLQIEDVSGRHLLFQKANIISLETSDIESEE